MVTVTPSASRNRSAIVWNAAISASLPQVVRVSPSPAAPLAPSLERAAAVPARGEARAHRPRPETLHEPAPAERHP